MGIPPQWSTAAAVADVTVTGGTSSGVAEVAADSVHIGDVAVSALDTKVTITGYDIQVGNITVDGGLTTGTNGVTVHGADKIALRVNSFQRLGDVTVGDIHLSASNVTANISAAPESVNSASQVNVKIDGGYSTEESSQVVVTHMIAKVGNITVDGGSLLAEVFAKSSAITVKNADPDIVSEIYFNRTEADTVISSSQSRELSALNASLRSDGASRIFAGESNDSITVVGDNSVIVDGGLGNDAIVTSSGSDLILGGLGTNTLSGNGGVDHYFLGYKYHSGDAFGNLLVESLIPTAAVLANSVNENGSVLSVSDDGGVRTISGFDVIFGFDVNRDTLNSGDATKLVYGKYRQLTGGMETFEVGGAQAAVNKDVLYYNDANNNNIVDQGELGLVLATLDMSHIYDPNAFTG